MYMNEILSRRLNIYVCQACFLNLLLIKLTEDNAIEDLTYYLVLCHQLSKKDDLDLQVTTSHHSLHVYYLDALAVRINHRA